MAVVLFGGLLALFGYPLVNSLTHVAERLPTMVDQVQRGHGWLAHTLRHFGLLNWVQKNAPRLQQLAHNLSKPALSVGANLGRAVFSTIIALTTIAFLSLFMLLEAPRLRAGLLGNLNPRLRSTVQDISTTVSHSVTAYVLGTVALGLLFGLVIFVTMVILGVPFALLLGLWVALVAMIPLVGGLIAAVPTVALALLHSPTAGVVAIVVFVGFQLVENHFLYPVVMSRTGTHEPPVGAAGRPDRGQPGRGLRFQPGRPHRGAGGHPGRGRHPGGLPRGLGAHPGHRRPRHGATDRPSRRSPCPTAPGSAPPGGD